jgi:hypothetical protein
VALVENREAVALEKGTTVALGEGTTLALECYTPDFVHLGDSEIVAIAVDWEAGSKTLARD